MLENIILGASITAGAVFGFILAALVGYILTVLVALVADLCG